MCSEHRIKYFDILTRQYPSESSIDTRGMFGGWKLVANTFDRPLRSKNVLTAWAEPTHSLFSIRTHIKSSSPPLFSLFFYIILLVGHWVYDLVEALCAHSEVCVTKVVNVRTAGDVDVAHDIKLSDE